ncbi:MAG TPA: hypothetical protein VF612_00685 [Jatrophihabitans sp.]|jgi:hypothetical protein|uniref:hypothetical protein n=1 Tax=Jatrophihabitans sp. TaxID=1932789 RepID=UPI002F171CB6
MVYTPDKPPLPVSIEELRATIPGWGADLDPKDRPSVPRERFDPGASGAHWDFPERQPEKWPRERSIEHASLTPVFGTSCPPKGLSGVIRKYAYRRYSEARAAHWLLLIAADRVDSVEASVTALLRGHPDNPVTETGILSEFSHHGLSSRFGRKRADVKHQWLDPIIVGGPQVLRGVVLYSVGKTAIRGVRGAQRALRASRPGPDSAGS